MRLTTLCYGALRVAGVTALARRLARGGVVLCYHNVVATTGVRTATELGLHMPMATFERQMRWLASHYAVVSLREFVDRSSRGESLRGVAAVTFDDGYAGVFEHAWPLLRALNIPATVFVVASAPERTEGGYWWDGSRPPPPPSCRPATWPAILEAARTGLVLGAHTVTHRALPTLYDEDLARELVRSRETIAQHTGQTPAFFAYPFGLWDGRVRDAVRAAGYRAAFTLDAGPNGAPIDAWAMPRVNVPAGIEDVAFEAWIAGLMPARQRTRHEAHAN
jgi:peptidoglycan/xylan/chitin deacetylase (PgdA/CDA1 family)